MFPDSPYAVPVPSFRTPVPLVDVDPQAEPLVYIGLNCEWFPVILGALKQLLLQTTWATDDPTALNLVQARVFTLMAAFDCSRLPTLAELQGVPGSGDCGEDCMCCLRVQNGVLQQLQCGVWTDVPGQPPGGFFPIPQPGDNQPLPQPGGCQQYHAQMPGNGTWLLPAPVSTGDTIDVTGAQGITYDGAHPSWRCPDGSEFILGVCTGLTHTDSGNPLPSVARGKLVANIGGTFYDVFNGVFTVPGGISSQPVTFQVNDADITGNGGNLTFDVEVCNNGSNNVTIAYTHGSGLTSAPYGTTFVVTAQDIGSDVRFDMTFSPPVKLTVVAQSGYVNTGTPGPTDVWCGWSLGGSQVGTMADPPNTLPTDFPSPQTLDALAMDTGAPGAVFTVTVRIDTP